MTSHEALDDILADLSEPQTALLAELWARIDLLTKDDLKDYNASTLAALAQQTGPQTAPGKFVLDRSFLKDKKMIKALENLTPAQAYNSLRNNAKHENPDTLLVRFLRARSWDLDAASAMLFSSLAWRIEEGIESKVIPSGDNIVVEGLSKNERQIADETITMLSSGQSFVHGADKDGRPVVYIRTKLHYPWAQGKEAFLRGCILDVESTRMLLRPPVTCVSIVFDMTGFGIRNMDMNVLKIMASGLQNNYPECLGSVYVFNAPWIVRGIWAAITGWLDPVVAGKVHFVNDVKKLAEFIPIQKIPKYMGGDDDWEFEWIPPSPPKTFTQEETRLRDAKMREREGLVDEFTDLSRAWSQSALNKDASVDALLEKRYALVKKLTENYWQVDKFWRGRVWIDRAGVLKPDGTCNL